MDIITFQGRLCMYFYNVRDVKYIYIYIYKNRPTKFRSQQKHDVALFNGTYWYLRLLVLVTKTPENPNVNKLQNVNVEF